MANPRLAICINKDHQAVTQYVGYNFNSMVVLPNGTGLGFNEDGVFKLDTGDTDNGTIIAAKISFQNNNLDTQIKKRPFYLHVLGAFTGDMIATGTTNGVSSAVQATPKTLNAESSVRLKFGRIPPGVYVQYSIENVNGCWFSICHVDAKVTLINRIER